MPEGGLPEVEMDRRVPASDGDGAGAGDPGSVLAQMLYWRARCARAEAKLAGLGHPVAAEAVPLPKPAVGEQFWILSLGILCGGFGGVLLTALAAWMVCG